MGYYSAGDYYMAGPVPLLGAGLAAARGWLSRGAIGQALGKVAAVGGLAAGADLAGDVIGGAADVAQAGARALGFGGRRGRRMNPLNPRALRRSMRRVQAFADFSRKTISFTKRVKMKKRRRR